MSQAVLAMIDVAQKSFRGWVDELRSSQRTCTIDANGLRVGDPRCRSANGPAAPKRPPRRRCRAGRDRASRPVDAVRRCRCPPIEVVELPELGAAGDRRRSGGRWRKVAAPAEETIEAARRAGCTAPHPIAEAGCRQHAARRRARTPIGRPTPITVVEPDEVTIGAVTLSASLWTILCDEAEQHLATLEHELSLLQFDSRSRRRRPRWCARATRCAASIARRISADRRRRRRRWSMR